MNYMFYHLKVRNDEYSTKCRQPVVFFCETWDDVYDNAKNYLLNFCEDYEKVLLGLNNNESLWIDEWVRRSNGDKYEIINIRNSNYCDSAIKFSMSDININFMLLHIKIRPRKLSPDNIKYNMSFHENIDNAKIKAHENKNFKDKDNSLEQFNSVWVVKDEDNISHGGDYFELFELEDGEIINLRKTCLDLKKFRH